MKKVLSCRPFVVIWTIVLALLPSLSWADPADPGGDPFGGSDATPINGNLAVVMILAFIFGVYKIMKLKKAKEQGKGGHE